MPDFKEQRLAQALEHAFDNRAGNDALAGICLTGLELSPDRRHVKLLWVAEDEDVDEALVEGALEGVRPMLEDEAEEVLRRRAKIRFMMDRGALNQQRVERILDELKGQDDAPQA